GFKKAGISTKSLSKGEIELRQNIEKTNKQIERQQDRMRRLAAQQRKLGEARERLQRAQAFAGSMAAAGAAGLGVGYGVKNMAERLLAPGISYGSQVSELQAVSRLDKDSEEMRALREQARGLGASTAF